MMDRPQPKGHGRLLESVGDVVLFLLVCAAYIVRAIVTWILPSRYRRRRSIKNEVVLITGGGGGLGRLLALRFTKLGATVVLWDINTTGLDETSAEVKALGGTVYSYRCDLSKREDVYRTAEKTKEDVGIVTILINNAGVASGHSFLDTPDHLIQRTFDVNILAHYWTTKAFLPDMLANKNGHIVTVASMAGYVGINKLVDYCGSKFAAVGFDEALRVELEAMGVQGVRTTVVSPYFIQSTGMFDNVRSFVPTLRGDDVADRIIRAIQDEELFVLMPGYLRLMLMFKWVFPWSCVSLFLRGLVPDAAPPTEQEGSNELLALTKTHKPASSTTADVALHRRITSAGERKP